MSVRDCISIAGDERFKEDRRGCKVLALIRVTEITPLTETDQSLDPPCVGAKWMVGMRSQREHGVAVVYGSCDSGLNSLAVMRSEWRQTVSNGSPIIKPMLITVMQLHHDRM